MKCSYKKICALILTLVMALSLTACGGDEPADLCGHGGGSFFPAGGEALGLSVCQYAKRTGRQYHADSGGTGSGRTGEAEGG